MGFIKEFKTFAIKGNMMDMAIGIIIGAAFGKIITSLVNDVIMPPLGMLLGGMDFTSFKFTLKEASEGVEAVTLNYGNFIQVFVDFLIVALAIFLVIKAMNRMKKKQEEAPAAPAEPPAQEKLLSEIRDLLKEKK
ncbi:MAG TPA: large-conductance mechanosensitive channel protein MscL [Bacteroidales bacterium]|nr:large-conductance mechanosensitive channel protein MscL [Bacteroidales bacterium]HRZ50101.1 large-conductance mechanosensitive channel protein MscL [Bacteroidales bacterium]